MATTTTTSTTTQRQQIQLDGTKSDWERERKGQREGKVCIGHYLFGWNGVAVSENVLKCEMHITKYGESTECTVHTFQSNENWTANCQGVERIWAARMMESKVLGATVCGTKKFALFTNWLEDCIEILLETKTFVNRVGNFCIQHVTQFKSFDSLSNAFHYTRIHIEWSLFWLVFKWDAMGGCRFDCIQHKRRELNHFCSTEIILDVEVCTKFAYVVVMLATLTHNHYRARTRRNFYSISRNFVQVLCTICIYLTDLAGMAEVFLFFP